MITQAITTFKTGDYSVARAAVGSYVNGLWIDGAITTTNNIAMAIQPISGRDLKTLPEGQKAEDVRLVLTTHALLVRDVITYAGEPWTVFRVEDWILRGATWSRAYMSRNTVKV